MFVNINSSTAHGTNYLGILGFARLPCTAKCSRLCWTRNIPCCRSPAVVQGKRPHSGGGSDSRNRQKSSLPLQYLFTCEPAWEQWCHIYNFQPLFFQQYYSYNTGNYGQESEAYTYTYPTGTPAQEQTQLQETNNIDLEKVMVYIECCVMLSFKFCWHFSLLLACMQLSSYSFFRSRSSL